ncbi:MAG: anthranilate phosphoribosyltransferase [Maricaulis maris]|jgi:anthranilate phosphoribosyltransferase|uniref:Anthranilate phosphoribosyltransferase n=1 Tax=Maricaulis maris (strain MCS10) TaxID=394221 RepID=TRPD_MARMM|nr:MULTISPECIES: anthranilate phosphoribosyltransferase [Maricaulis]Q0APU5.1 RecName: Full=Anthranilate phosphoribosyltransferase [Maricaulis maris MCS10]ABI65692.1 anthranilate phosphoribosyltransferase [Maricaulis maris MCS10]MAC88879.1 anthranilate phosphoribosyltransferase [Maricaulis sp.]
MQNIYLCLTAFARGTYPDDAAIAGAFDELMSGDAPDAAIGGFLVGLAALGERPSDIAAGARALRSRMTRIEAPVGAIDTCGTGGDGKGAWNISTTAAIIAAGAGATVAKHGNRAASSKSGSSDVLAQLGVKLDCPPAAVERSLAEARVGFLFAPAHHAAVRHVGPARQALKVRTVFNLLGPLSNPAGVKRQLLGVYDRRWLVPIAEALRDLGCEHALVICGQDGMDELTTTTGSDIAELRDGDIREYSFHPEEAGLALVREADLQGGTPADNAAAIRALLDGQQGAFRDIAILNAGAALVLAGLATTIPEGTSLAAAAIDDGRAKAALMRMVAISNGEA